jgi:hypothetical protein
MTSHYTQFCRKEVFPNGPSIDELLQAGQIKTPYPHAFRGITLTQNPGWRLFVFVPASGKDIAKEFDALGLTVPSIELSIRCASQMDDGNRRDAHRGATIIFPHPPYVDPHIKPAAESWLALVWRPETQSSELLLWDVNRPEWPRKALFAGIAYD